MINVSYCLVLSFIFISCEKKEIYSTSKTPSSMSTDVSFGEQKEIPFEINSMTEKYKSEGKLQQNEILKPNYYYYRFTIKDAKEYKLLASAGVRLSPFPLDRTLKGSGNTSVINPDKTNYQYASVESGIAIPESIKKEVLASMFVPSDELMKINELKNQRISANDIRGTINIKDPVTGSNVPLKGVTVVVQDWFYYQERLTGTDGKYQVPNTYTGQANIYLKMDNADFDLRTIDGENVLGFGNPVTYYIIYQYNNTDITYNIDITKNRQLLYASTVLYAMNQFKAYSSIPAQNIPLSSTKLSVWLFKGFDTSMDRFYVVPMLRTMGGTSPTLLYDYFYNYSKANNPGAQFDHAGFAASVRDAINSVIGYGPDVIFAYNQYGSYAPDANTMQTMTHEYCHVSHYQKVGYMFWSNIHINFIDAVLRFGTTQRYGDGKTPAAAYSCLAESWAEDLSWEIMQKNYPSATFLTLPPSTFRDDLVVHNYNSAYTKWFPTGIFYDLSDNTNTPSTEESGIIDNISGVTFKQMNDQFSTSTTSLSLFKDAIKNNVLTTQAEKNNTDTLFISYKMKHNSLVNGLDTVPGL